MYIHILHIIYMSFFTCFLQEKLDDHETAGRNEASPLSCQGGGSFIAGASKKYHGFFFWQVVCFKCHCSICSISRLCKTYCYHCSISRLKLNLFNCQVEILVIPLWSLSSFILCFFFFAFRGHLDPSWGCTQHALQVGSMGIPVDDQGFSHVFQRFSHRFRGGNLAIKGILYSLWAEAFSEQNNTHIHGKIIRLVCNCTTTRIYYIYTYIYTSYSIYIYIHNIICIYII